MHGLVVGAGDGAGHLLGGERFLHPHGVVAGQVAQPAGEEGLQCEVPAVLLADQHDQGCAVHPGGGQRPDRIAQPCRRVQLHQRRTAVRDRPPGRHAHDRPLVQRQHEAQVLGQVGEEADLGGPRVGEDRGQAVPAEHVEGGVADRALRAPGSVRLRHLAPPQVAAGAEAACPFLAFWISL